MSKPFVHIHNHTEYSLLDGMQRIGPMVDRAKEMGQPAIAITDHGAMYGALEFYLECKAKGVKPIIGMEAYVAPEGRLVKSGREEKSTYHLLLLAKNEVGYKNLSKLSTISALEGFYDIVERAARAAEAASLPLSDATRANLRSMGISVAGQEEAV